MRSSCRSRAFAQTRESWNFVKSFFINKIVKREAAKLDAILAKLIKQRFDVILQEKTDLSNKKGLGLMDLILRDYVRDIRQSGQKDLDPAFLDTAITQVKTLLVAGSGTTSDVICYSMMM
jgi:cytochrome P450